MTTERQDDHSTDAPPTDAPSSPSDNKQKKPRIWTIDDPELGRVDAGNIVGPGESDGAA